MSEAARDVLRVHSDRPDFPEQLGQLRTDATGTTAGHSEP